MTVSSEPSARHAGTFSLGGDLPVHRLGFGAMRLTGEGIWGWPKDKVHARRVLHRAVELGINFIDTSDAYGPGVNEEQIADALHPYPAGLVVATKGGLSRPTRVAWDRAGSPQALRNACDASLKRLRLERIELYQLHAPDPRVPIEDSVGELARLQEEGKIRHIGVSNFSLSLLHKVEGIARITSVQNRYNITDRQHDDVLAYCESHKIAFIPYFPLGEGEHASSDDAHLHRISEEYGLTRAQASLAWLLARSPVMLPIPGTSSLAHLEENVGAASVKVSLI